MLSLIRVEYKCHFCRDRLKTVEPTMREYALALFGLRNHFCPHCFEISLRPVGWLKLLTSPLVVLARVGRALALRD